MIETFRGIWRFAGEEKRNIGRSVIACFFNAVFHMFEIAAIYYTILALLDGKTGPAGPVGSQYSGQRRDQIFLPARADPRRVLHGGK